MQFGIWIGIFISALLSYGIALFYEQPIHWYVLILLIVTGLFINTVILILRMQDQDEHNSWDGFVALSFKKLKDKGMCWKLMTFLHIPLRIK